MTEPGFRLPFSVMGVARVIQDTGGLAGKWVRWLFVGTALGRTHERTAAFDLCHMCHDLGVEPRRLRLSS